MAVEDPGHRDDAPTIRPPADEAPARTPVVGSKEGQFIVLSVTPDMLKALMKEQTSRTAKQEVAVFGAKAAVVVIATGVAAFVVRQIMRPIMPVVVSA